MRAAISPGAVGTPSLTSRSRLLRSLAARVPRPTVQHGRLSIIVSAKGELHTAVPAYPALSSAVPVPL